MAAGSAWPRLRAAALRAERLLMPSLNWRRPGICLAWVPMPGPDTKQWDGWLSRSRSP